MPTNSAPTDGKKMQRKGGSTFLSTGAPEFAWVVSEECFHCLHRGDTNLTLWTIEQYALAESSYVLVRLLQQFDVLENAQPEITLPQTKTNLTMSHKDGVKVRLWSSSPSQSLWEWNWYLQRTDCPYALLIKLILAGVKGDVVYQQLHIHHRDRLRWGLNGIEDKDQKQNKQMLWCVHDKLYLQRLMIIYP